VTGGAITPARNDGPLRRLVDVLERALSDIPHTDETKGHDPEARAREIARRAAMKAATFSGSLALPPGPLGYVTIIPDLVGIWRIQAQMVADVAGAFGQEGYLSREQMLYCLFRHAAAQAMRDLVVRVGERVLIRRPSFRVIEHVLQKVGLRVSQRLAGKAIARWLPIVGALGVGAYAYYDTGQVAETAIDLFRREIAVEDAPGNEP
jgi:hypothetical protein